MKLVIVVLNWNQRDATLACLASLRQADLRRRARAGRRQRLARRLGRGGARALPERARPARCRENRGYAGGNNAGIRAALDAGAEAVLLLNNDTRVAPDFLLPLLWALNEHPRAGAVCSAIHRMDRPEMLDVAYAEVRFAEREAVQAARRQRPARRRASISGARSRSASAAAC